MRISVVTDYEVTSYTDVELPEGKTSDDIKDIGFKWGRGSIVFKDGTSMDGIEQEEYSHEYFKRPTEITFKTIEDMDCLEYRIDEVGQEWLENNFRYRNYDDVYQDFKDYFFDKYPVYGELYEDEDDGSGGTQSEIMFCLNLMIYSW